MTNVISFPKPGSEEEPEGHEEPLATPAESVLPDPWDARGEPRTVFPWESLEAFLGEIRYHAGRYQHASAYHGVRSGVYLLKTLWYSLRGVRVLGGRLIRWWHAPDLWLLESQGVARGGRDGHADAMKAHVEGKKTRAVRGKIIFLSLAAAVFLLALLADVMPRWGWAVFGAVLIVTLAYHGRPAGRSIIDAAEAPPRYQKPTPEVITRGFASLGIPAIDRHLGQGEKLDFITDPYQSGQGWGCDLNLPHGVTARMILQRREQLSSGLHRPLSAVWPEGVAHEHEGRLRLWIGFDDLSKMKLKVYPLLKAGESDVFTQGPFGTDPRGRPVTAGLFEMNWLIGSAPGQGKTSAVRVLACNAALDPLCDLWVHELAGKGDLEPLAQVSHRYVSGLDDESIAYAADSLAVLRAELSRRSARLKGLPKEQRPDGKITRELAGRSGLGLRPVVAVFDEVQNLFMHPDHGKQAQADAAYVIRMGRAYGIILVLSTQRPDKESIPTAVTGNIVCRYCMRVPSHNENDMILGTSAHQNGYRATVFRAKTDAGLGWLKAEGDPQIMRTYYLDLPATSRIAARARVMRAQRGVLSGYAAGQEDEAESRDFLADVLTVFGPDEKLWCSTIADRLRERIPEAYASVTQAAVSDQLRFRGVEVKNVRETGEVPRKGAERAAVESALNGCGGTGA